MASITIRNLDEDVKEALRRQAAANGRSMEEEVRVLLSGETQVPAPLVPASDPVAQSLKDKRILLIIGGGIAAYKVLDLIRRLKERGAQVRPVMTEAAQAFITPLSVGALAADHVYTDLFSREDEQDVGHIRLARDADLIVVAPATADRMAQMVAGLGGDLAAAILLARKVPVLIAPAMNPAMWNNPATQRNVKVLHQDGVHFIGPERGEMAEKGEAGTGRMSEPLQIVAKIEQLLLPPQYLPLKGKKIIITSGPTHEPIDPVRYIANRSSGKQGHAIAAALARLGADVRLVAGPVTIPDPQGVTTIHVETARQMRDAVEAQLPADAAVMVAAVADWRTANAADQKIKKQAGEAAPSLQMVENPDILATIGHHELRPRLVIGFAAETQNVVENARKKLDKKGANWIAANNVSFAEDGSSVMGGDHNQVLLVSRDGVDEWPLLDKDEVALRLAEKIAAALS
ncbi:phosphopantothenoylcysteine decarboxylase/phosphopantothenate--cysteine ligase [Pseudochrobactrum saccharolyticum]|uniref:Coenzyme A biosynthesis bifunctional protein CoaBC n=1 Tax=Pseudochrobactrum saccharolyticum TaxID=354352 RepID=A0A7W8EQS3_9HYPH|nr:bifunctional phosphopantothenoylcysteine decarboxylase/phosphopantothenate--cysteine ligase CoaBC [Pseudochrobactrum saccharolyticum]KAB0537311.1 bifunctional phosphopantothenoylcysteine decarboxylase/phosphopantothenate--cysteine ligase CoaBC [Pseudochrobactrum saccharolyticum]MBB5092206.1 phosphopantothenoylcysteine decarboxylase/phosphopantothenate--cysteine ligase [Pseudochrobactrum saccharolyticum]